MTREEEGWVWFRFCAQRATLVWVEVEDYLLVAAR